MPTTANSHGFSVAQFLQLSVEPLCCWAPLAAITASRNQHSLGTAIERVPFAALAVNTMFCLRLSSELQPSPALMHDAAPAPVAAVTAAGASSATGFPRPSRRTCLCDLDGVACSSSWKIAVAERHPAKYRPARPDVRSFALLLMTAATCCRQCLMVACMAKYAKSKGRHVMLN